MPASNSGSYMFGEKFKDLDELVDKLKDSLSSIYQEVDICKLFGIDIGKLNNDEKISLINRFYAMHSGNQKIDEHGGCEVIQVWGETSKLLVAGGIFEILGFEDLAKYMKKLRAEIFIESNMKETRKKAAEKRAISADRSKAKKGKTNRHHSDVIKIASLTWEKHPHASLAGMSQEIYSHLRDKWNDVPVLGTIEKWLKESGLNPEVKPKNRDFKLVVIDE